MTGFCTEDQDEFGSWRCATFITFIVTYVLLAFFGVWLYVYLRWQANLEKRLLLEDYQFQQQHKSNRTSSKN